MGSIILGKDYFPKDELYSVSNISKSANILRIKKLQPGDLLLVKTPGMVYKIGRKLTKNIYDHIAVVLYNEETLNIVVPKTVIRSTSIFARPNRIPLIMRPKWRNPEQQKKFIKEMEKFRKSLYNARKTLVGVFLNTLYSRLGISFRIKS